MGGVRRVPRQSTTTTNPASGNSTTALTPNWTIQKTTTYNSALPANAPVAWGGTSTALDRSFISTGSGYAALGALITWVNKPDSIAGVVIKIQPTYLSVEIPFLEMWTLNGAVWTKRNRIALSSRVRTGETLVVDFTSTIYAADTVDAIWITLVPSGTETLTWLVLHTYGVCDADSIVPDCPPGTLPEDCNNTECDTDPTTWLATAGCTPTILPIGSVLVRMPTDYAVQPQPDGKYYVAHCPGPTHIVMDFIDVPTNCTVVVTTVDTHGFQFSATIAGAAVTSQTISAAGTLTWFIVAGTGYHSNTHDGFPPATIPDLMPPFQITPYMTFRFERTMNGALVNMLEPLSFFWTTSIGYSVGAYGGF